jgi:hypothetical protein
MLPNIRDDATNALIQLPQGSLSYATYTQEFNDFYEGLDNLFRTAFSAFASSKD